MAGKRAAILSDQELSKVLSACDATRHPDRNKTIFALTFKAGLRISEVSKLDWSMVLDASGQIGPVVNVLDQIAKKRGGRVIPMHPLLRDALERLKAGRDVTGPVIQSERGGAMRPVALCNALSGLFKKAGLSGASSHSGRRTFITKAARAVGRVGGSLRDVQRLAGHADLKTTSIYIEDNSDAQQRLVRML